MSTDLGWRSLRVDGLPQPAGSKRALPLHGKKGERAIVVDANPKAAAWKAHVAARALDEWGIDSLTQPPEGPMHMLLTFYRARPASHFGTGRNAGVLKKDAPPLPTGAPDVLKLARGVEDALKGIAYKDDAQIVYEVLGKRWGAPGVLIEVGPYV